MEQAGHGSLLMLAQKEMDVERPHSWSNPTYWGIIIDAIKNNRQTYIAGGLQAVIDRNIAHKDNAVVRAFLREVLIKVNDLERAIRPFGYKFEPSMTEQANRLRQMF